MTSILFTLLVWVLIIFGALSLYHIFFGNGRKAPLFG
jgi:hypothetical protein